MKRIAVIGGDGTGPEVVAEGLKCLQVVAEKVGFEYETEEFDTLKQKAKYGKQDSFNAGKIKPENISGNGSVKLRLTAHNVAEKNTDDKSGQALVGTGGKQTGIAWFNYALVTPVPVPGRVNINSAPERLLSSLPGIESTVAKNIFYGTDRNGKRSLKPYQRLGDILKVKGMTPEIFERCANILALDSSAFTIEIEAQIVSRASRREHPNLKKGPVRNVDIIAARKKRFIINYDRTENDNFRFNLLEKN